MQLGSVLGWGVWFVTIGLAAMAPTRMEPFWRRIHHTYQKLARRKLLCCAAAALLVLGVRIALLPVWEIPKPYIHDEYGYLLQADTFASGRLTNPTHPLSDFFEAPYILQTPTYNAKYPPGQGFMLALGQVTLGHPWFGVWLSCGALAAALCWALQGWFRPEWALFGTVFVLPLCTFSSWMNSYWGGAVAGIGGALVFGALPRLRRGRVLDPAILAMGAVLLALTRPFEGLVVTVPVLAVMLSQKLNTRQWLSFVLVATAGAAFLGYYNATVTGHALRMPYVEYDKQYPMTSHFNFLPLPAQQHYREAGIAWVDQWERIAWAQAQTPSFLLRRLTGLRANMSTFLGSWIVLVPLMLFMPEWFGNRRFRAIRWALGLTLVVAFVELLYFTHYAAPALAPLLLLVVQAFRHLRQWKTGSGKLVGAWLVRLTPAAVLLVAMIYPVSKLVKGSPMQDPSAGGRELLEASLEGHVGPHVILVLHTNRSEVEAEIRKSAYSQIELATSPLEFVHNGANINQQNIIWANYLGEEDNHRLYQYYSERTFWLYQPEEDPDMLHRLQNTR